MRLPVRILPLLLVTLALPACSDGTGPNLDGATIDLLAPSERLAVGATAQIGATVRSAAGEPLTGVRLAWSSGDTSTVVVDTAGTVTARRAGQAWVTARAGPVSDSALVQVMFQVDPGGAAARVRATGVDRVVGLEDALAIHIDVLDPAARDYTFAFASNADGDTILYVLLPGLPTEGVLPIAEFALATLDTLSTPTVPMAFLLVQSLLFVEVVPLKGSLELDVLLDVPGPGIRSGLLSARLVASGTAHRANPQADPLVWNATTRTVSVVADLQPLYGKESSGSSSGQLTGTPQPVTWRSREAFWYPDDTKRRPHRLDVIGSPPDIYVFMPGTASTDLGPVAQTNLAFLEIADSSATGYTGTATTGRVQITRYVAPPAADLFGEVHGSVTASGAGQRAAGPFSFQTTFEFHAPVYPATVLGSPASTAPGLDRRGARGSLARVLPRVSALR